MGILRKHKAPQHLSLAFTCSGCAGLILSLGRLGGRQEVGIERLKLDGIRARISSNFDQPMRELQISVVINPSLTDDETAGVRADPPPSDYQVSQRPRHSPCAYQRTVAEATRLPLS